VGFSVVTLHYRHRPSQVDVVDVRDWETFRNASRAMP
jgi:hypothetical protein